MKSDWFINFLKIIICNRQGAWIVFNKGALFNVRGYGVAVGRNGRPFCPDRRYLTISSGRTAILWPLVVDSITYWNGYFHCFGELFALFVGNLWKIIGFNDKIHIGMMILAYKEVVRRKFLYANFRRQLWFD
jgi:hypothetical protein